jgi:hypothetical protein
VTAIAVPIPATISVEEDEVEFGQEFHTSESSVLTYVYHGTDHNKCGHPYISRELFDSPSEE